MNAQSTLFDVEADLIRKSATFSPCGRYRYLLEREWDARGPTLVFLMLNPSTADAVDNDPTVTRCIGFAKAWGYGRLVVINCFALRSTDPKGLYEIDDPVGPENDATILRVATQGEATLICAWGNHGEFKGRYKAVTQMLTEAGVPMYCLAITKTGMPGHPSYLPGSVKPMAYEVAI